MAMDVVVAERKGLGSGGCVNEVVVRIGMVDMVRGVSICCDFNVVWCGVVGNGGDFMFYVLQYAITE